MNIRARSIGAASILLALTAVAVACTNHSSNDETDSVTSDDSTGRVGLSFLVASDLHFGYIRGQPISADQLAADPNEVDVDVAEPDDEDEADDATATSDPGNKELILNQQLAQAMSSVSMKSASTKVKNAFAKLGMSNDFRGALVTGDVTDNGQGYQWKQFTGTYGFNGEALLNMPVFETAGNHDYPWRTTNKIYSDPSQDYVVSKIASRATGHAHTVAHDKGGAYAIKWDNVLVVNLGVKASNKDDTLIPAKDPDGNNLYRNTNPFDSLQFLNGVLNDKTLNPSGTRVILSFHYPIQTSDYRMTDAERQALYNVIKGHRISAIIHGHRHVSSHYEWCQIPVFEVDTPRSAWTAGYDSSFLAVDVNATRIKATTIRWRTQSDGVPDVGVNDNANCNLAKSTDSCWTAEKAFADIPIQNDCKHISD